MTSDQAPLNTTSPVEDTEDVRELFKAIAFAAVIALCIRSFLFEPFNIPSGSMLPSLLVGDYLFVEKYAYGYSQYSFPFGVVRFSGRILEKIPERGDVAVFRQPKNTRIDYIKRIIGLPGDRIQVKEGILYVNGKPVVRDYQDSENYKDDQIFHVYKKYIETLPNDVKHYIYEISDTEGLDNTPVFVVPEGHYFAMGDNRDSSQDSRVMSAVGFVPAENLVGRAALIFFSTEGVASKCPMGDGNLAFVKRTACWLTEIPKSIRFSRMFTRIHGL